MTKAPCHVKSIEGELSHIWESLEGSHKTWASLFNIVFYTKSAANTKNFQWLLDLISKKFPCRSLFIREDPDPSQEYLNVDVTAETLGEGEMSVVCDQIFIEVAGSEREKVPFLILPHFLPDLPMYVIWTQEPDENDPILQVLRKYASKLVYDPGFCGNLQRFSGELLKQMEDCNHCGITDLCWILTSGWREAFASTFQTQQRINELFRARFIRIGYNQGQHPCVSDENQALYFQAWIAAQFNWKVSELERIEGNVRASYARFMYETVVLLAPENNPNLAPGAITSIEIETENQAAHFLFKRSSEGDKVKIWISSCDRCDIPYEIFVSQGNLEHMVLSELFRKGVSEQYRNVLRLLYELHWHD